MLKNTIDGKMLQKMFLAGAKSIESKKEWINELNVFPVPDGDTGTNMTLTIMSAAKEVVALKNPDMESLSKAIASGSLRGARGNSGVILSQLFRGFTKEIKLVQEIDVLVLANALQRATESAYKAVMKPKEGTILTVARAVGDKASEMAMQTTDMKELMEAVLIHAEEVLEKTPEMLPVLKQAGVVDSGGQGLLEILKGAYDAYLGKEIDYTIEAAGNVSIQSKKIDTSDIQFGYCTEFIIMVEKAYGSKEEKEFKSYLESIGDSIVAVSDDDIVKVHVHTNDPGLAIQKALTIGSLTSMKIDNMREEHEEKLIKEAEKIAAEDKKLAEKASKKDIGFVVVSAGKGLVEIFKGLGVDEVIEGGQTMNPSTEDILSAVEKVNADTIFVFPNNGNIILAAEQASKIEKEKNIVVIPSKTVPQGITALINFIPGNTVEENVVKMSEEMKRVKTGQVTYAVRDTVIDDREIKENDIMGIGDKTILATGKDIEETTIEMLQKMVEDDSELISIYYGADVLDEEAEKLSEKLEEIFPDQDIELNMGGQPVYYYLISVE